MQEMHEVSSASITQGRQPNTQRKPEIEKGKDETHVSALSVSEQVLLTTCKVKVTASNASSMIARALIDPASSFIYECLAQYLRLPCGSKSARVEGIGETSTPTRGSEWFQVSGFKDDGEKTCIEENNEGSTCTSASYPTCPQMGALIGLKAC